jgi:hypothetical protein
MSSSDAFALRRFGLDEFLFASIGTEPSGMTLSLLSVFARRGDDPWNEAGKLVGLPKGDAIDSIAQAIVRMPRSVWTLPDATTIATRLVALLPVRLGNSQSKASVSRPRVTRLVGLALMLAVTIGMASALGLFTSHHAPEFDVGNVSTLASLPSTRAPTN